MSQSIQVNGQTINYPETGDTNWADDATNFAIQTSAAFGKIGLSAGTSVDITQTLDVTGNTTLDANLSVGGNASVTGNTTLTGNLTVNGNTQLGNANTDTIGVTGIVNVDSGVLYVDPINNRVGINDTTPSEALDITGNALISGTLGVTGATSLSDTLGVIGNVSVNTNKFNITASSGNTNIAGTLGVTGDVAINTNKFNVTASSGNTTIAGTLGISNGTALAPAITPSGDTNTGLYSISADKIGFSANGVRQGEFGVGYGGFTGNIIQAQSTTGSTQFSTTSSTPQASSIKLSFTPKYSNSKLLFLVSAIFGNNTSGSWGYINIRNNTDSVNVTTASSAGVQPNNGSGLYVNIFLSAYYNSPGVTAKEYEIYINTNGTGTAFININNYPSIMTVLEVQQ